MSVCSALPAAANGVLHALWTLPPPSPNIYKAYYTCLEKSQAQWECAKGWSREDRQPSVWHASALENVRIVEMPAASPASPPSATTVAFQAGYEAGFRALEEKVPVVFKTSFEDAVRQVNTEKRATHALKQFLEAVRERPTP